MRADQVLDAAADLIERDGWIQGDGSNCLILDGSCAATAVHKAVLRAFPAAGIDELCARINDNLAPFVNALGGDSHDAIWKWNDAPARTKEEVVAMLRAVAINLRAADAGTVKTPRDSTAVPLACIDTVHMEKIA